MLQNKYHNIALLAKRILKMPQR